MCGIAGFVTGASSGTARELVSSAMGACLQQRKPDDHGIWPDEACGVALVQRRLSILDLSPAGHQPMISADGPLVIIYNGEVYSQVTAFAGYNRYQLTQRFCQALAVLPDQCAALRRRHSASCGRTAGRLSRPCVA